MNGFCPKCGGAGWVWGRELEWASDATREDTLTNYTCDMCKGLRVETEDCVTCEGEGTLYDQSNDGRDCPDCYRGQRVKG